MSGSDSTLVTTTLLLERLRDARDEQAWNAFDARFRGLVLAAALGLGLTRADADDAAQETMFQAYRDYQSGKYDRSRGRLSSWLIAIAHHRIIDIQRRRQRAARAQPLQEELPLSEAQVVDAFDRALERLVFEGAWARVKDRTRPRDQALRAFELTAMRGVPIREAAEQCSLSIDQVYVARNRIAARLREEADKIDKAYRDGF